MEDVCGPAHEVFSMRAGQLAFQVDKEVVPKEAFGGLSQVSDVAADAAVGAPALGGELLPQAVFSQAKELVLLLSPW